MTRISPWTALSIALLTGAVAIQAVRATHWGYFSGQMTEWLINYQGGFVRRGLPGELFFQVQALTGVPANWLVIAASLTIYGALICWLARHATPRFGWPLLASSVLLGASAFHGFIIRKDALMIVGLIACLAIDRRDKSTSSGGFLARNAIAVAALLSHEAFAFIALAAVVAMRLRQVGWRGMLDYLPALLALAAAIHWHGDPATAAAINESWRDLWHAINPAHCCFEKPSRSIAWLAFDTDHAFRTSIRELTGGRSGAPSVPMIWAATTILCGGAILFAGKDNPPEETARLTVTMLCQLAFVAPLAAIGSDTGRWIVLWALSTVVLHLHGFADTGWPRRLADRLASAAMWQRISRIEYDPRVLLLFGVPGCCWSIGNYLSASPVGFYVNGIWLYFAAGLRW